MITLPRQRGLSILLFAVMGLALSAVPASAQQFATINVPGAFSTNLSAINNLGQIVGDYEDDSGNVHGFLLSGGTFTTIDYPGATWTIPEAINNNGDIVGSYETESGDYGFLFRNGVFSSISDPAFPEGTIVSGIADTGLMVGYGTDANSHEHGFTLANGVFTTIDYPNASLTGITGVNFSGTEFVGFYELPSFPVNSYQGFTYIGGAFNSVSFPQSYITAAYGVNDFGVVAGDYLLGEESPSQAFLLQGTTFTTPDFPSANYTTANGLNDLTQVVGNYSSESAAGGYLETNGPFLYTAGSNGVGVLDAATDLNITTIPVNAYELAVTPDQSTLYVADAGNDTVSVIETATNTVETTIPVGSFPDGVAVTPDGRSVYVANNGGNNPSSDTVSVINTDSNQVIKTVTVGPAPFLPKVTPDGSHVYVSNQNNTISAIDTATNTVSSTITLSAEATGLVFTPNGAFAYVGENTSPGNVAVLAIPGNTVVATIPLGAGTASPIKLAITPDGSLVYVTNLGSNNVSVINTSTNSVAATVAVGKIPYSIAASPDGSLIYVGNIDGNTISVISTATNKVISTFSVPSGVTGIAVVGTPPTTQTITQPLSPTLLNTFNFGTNSFTVQYPPGTSFSGISMTVTDVEITQAEFAQRLAGTQFAGSTCIIYGGAGGNCVDYQVTCSYTSSGDPVVCPSEATPTIAVQTIFTTLQPVINPGFLTTPIGENDWTNIFTGYSDPIVKGKTKGFSEFVAVDLPVTNPQGAGTLSFVAPLQSTNPRTFGSGFPIPAAFQLTSIANPTQSITNAVANLTLVMVSNASGQAQSNVILALQNAFKFQSASNEYLYQINTTGFAPGTYVLTVYGNSFAAQHVQFTIDSRIATICSVQASSSLFYSGKPITLTGTVLPSASTSVTPTGSISFIDSANSLFVLGSAPLVGYSASIVPVLTAPPDRQWIKVTYPGDNNFQPCTSLSIAENYSSK
jgi:YVTN family beta-propeller protein/probable HAF family extracellular repeat protein